MDEGGVCIRIRTMGLGKLGGKGPFSRYRIETGKIRVSINLGSLRRLSWQQWLLLSDLHLLKLCHGDLAE